MILINNKFIFNNINIIKNFINSKKAFFITRFEYGMVPLYIYNYCGSHDAFIFENKTLKKTILSKSRKTQVFENCRYIIFYIDLPRFTVSVQFHLKIILEKFIILI